jgi:hypothetical protein
MLFYPTPDRHLDEVTAAVPDPDPAEYVDPFLPLVNALEEEDAGRRRDILMQVVRDTADPGADPDTHAQCTCTRPPTRHSGRRDPVRRPQAMPWRDIGRLRNALNFTSHTLRMDISGIPDSKVAAECAT